MAGAQVVILNADVDVERSTVSAEDGSYTFKKLKPGHYQMSAKVDGYASSGIINVDVIPGQSVNSDISLKLMRTASPLRNSGSGYRTYSGAYHAEPASRVRSSTNNRTSAKEPFERRNAAATAASDPPKTPRPPPASRSPLQSRMN